MGDFTRALIEAGNISARFSTTLARKAYHLGIISAQATPGILRLGCSSCKTIV